MSSVTQKILVFLSELSPGSRFTSQRLIHVGSRSALDSALSRLFQKGLIQRVSWGAYVNTPNGEKYKVAPEEIAQLKAQAFNKVIFPAGETIARLLQFPGLVASDSSTAKTHGESKREPETFSKYAFEQRNSSESEHELETIVAGDDSPGLGMKRKKRVLKFYTNGSGANFDCLDSRFRVKLVPLSEKKLRNYFLEGGYWVNAVRAMGRQYFERYQLQLKKKMPPFRTSLNSLKESFELMPGWLYSNLNSFYASHHNRRKHKLIEIPELLVPVPKEHLELIWGPNFRWGS